MYFYQPSQWRYWIILSCFSADEVMRLRFCLQCQFTDDNLTVLLAKSRRFQVVGIAALVVDIQQSRVDAQRLCILRHGRAVKV